MTDEKRKAIVRKVNTIIEACENICEGSSRLVQEQAKVVAYEHIRAILRGDDK